MQTFVAAFDTLFGGFRQRAQKTFELLQADGTAFLVVAAPEPDALREAAYFVERLSEDEMPLAGLVVNRASPAAGERRSRPSEAMAAAARLAPRATRRSLTAGLLRLHADRTRIVEREALLRERFAAAHPGVPTAVVPALADGRARPRRAAPGRRAARRRLRLDAADAAARRGCAGSDVRRGGLGGSALAASRTARHEASSGGDAAAPGAHARSSRPRHPTRSGCRAPRRGTRCARGSPRTPAWPCSARRPARRAASGCASRHAAAGAQSSTHIDVPTSHPRWAASR